MWEEGGPKRRPGLRGDCGRRLSADVWDILRLCRNDPLAIGASPWNISSMPSILG
jgi:hypothetical protein